MSWRQRWPGLHVAPWLCWAFGGLEAGLAIEAGIQHAWSDVINSTLVGLLFIFFPLVLRRTFRKGYSTGWLSGRIAMLSSLQEARVRGLTPTEWMVAEAERDGVHVRVVHNEGPDR